MILLAVQKDNYLETWAQFVLPDEPDSLNTYVDLVDVGLIHLPTFLPSDWRGVMMLAPPPQLEYAEGDAEDAAGRTTDGRAAVSVVTQERDPRE